MTFRRLPAQDLVPRGNLPSHNDVRILKGIGERASKSHRETHMQMTGWKVEPGVVKGKRLNATVNAFDQRLCECVRSIIRLDTLSPFV